MATAATGPTATQGRARRTRLGLLTSAIGLKLVMAATGVILSGFVLGHMIGNLKAFEGSEALNAYGRLLRFEPALLWTVRLGLLASVGLHIWAYVLLYRNNWAARPRRYRVTAYRESSVASRSMWLTGPLLLVFIIYHLLHLTTGTVHPSFREGDVYHNVIAGLRTIPVAVAYVLAAGALGFHLWHGVYSMFATLGAGRPKYLRFGHRFAIALTLIVVVGFAAVPLSVLAGYLK